MHDREADNKIIRRVAGGESAAYAIIVGRYQQYVFTLVLRYVPQRELAEELAQDVFVKAYNFLRNFREESKFSTWLYTIVHTTCLSHLRKKPASARSFDEDELQHLALPFSQNNAGSVIEQRSEKAMIESAINMLKADDAEVLTLYYQAEQSIEEIAQIIGIPAGTIKVKLHRARQKLRYILTKHFAAELPHLNHA